MLISSNTGYRIKSVKKLTEDLELKTDYVATEEPLEIVLVYYKSGKAIHKAISITMRTPGDDENLVRGFLYTEGILLHPSTDIERFEYRFSCTGDVVEQQTILVHLQTNALPNIDQLDRHFYTNSSCGVCGKTSIDLVLDNCSFILKKELPIISRNILFDLMNTLNQDQELFRLTGGIHACGLFDTNGKLLHKAEDVGRHNALDKLIGKALDNGLVPLDDKIVVLSGRASFEMIHKAFMAGTAIIAAVGAPSSLAVETAEAMGMSLIGFLKPHSANIYCGAQRIQVS